MQQAIDPAYERHLCGTKYPDLKARGVTPQQLKQITKLKKCLREGKKVSEIATDLEISIAEADKLLHVNSCVTRQSRSKAEASAGFICASAITNPFFFFLSVSTLTFFLLHSFKYLNNLLLLTVKV